MAEDTDVIVLAKLEGMTFEEAKETYTKREKLPITSFCGPSLSYPCHGVSEVRDSYERLMRVKPDSWTKILKCIQSRAKRLNINVGFSESKLVNWYLKKMSPKQKCKECE